MVDDCAVCHIINFDKRNKARGYFLFKAADWLVLSFRIFLKAAQMARK